MTFNWSWEMTGYYTNADCKQTKPYSNKATALCGSMKYIFACVLSSCAKNSISKMTNEQVWWSGVKSGCPESEWVGVRRTWLQFMCCAASCRCVPNFGRWGWIGDWRFGDDFIVKDRSRTKMTRREIQIVEQEGDLRDKCSERTMSKISRDSN